MPAKFVVQRKVDVPLFKRYREMWIDTQWTSLALAKEKFPELEFREVMVQW